MINEYIEIKKPSHAQIQIAYNNMKMDYYHSFYSQYGYKTMGMILRLLHTYCTLHYAEHCIVGDGKIYYPSEPTLFATYTWDDERQLAIIDFVDKQWQSNQDIFIMMEDKIRGIKRRK